jgi:dolichyl-phosphate beta-glucosyltransferase
LKKSRAYFLSVVIPVYNETKRINGLVEICHYFKKQKYSTEILVVNDGSTDNTLSKLKKLQKKNSFEIINYSKNRGKGYAIKTGLQKASGEHVLFTDIDLSTPLDQFEKFRPFLKKHDLVIGTRKTGSALLVKHQPKLRENLGKIFTFLSQQVLGVHVSDFTCGFKCFSGTAAKEISGLMKIDRWGFDSEILFLTKKKGYSVKEVPVKWENDPHTKVKFPDDIISSLKELYLIRKNDFQKLYG